MNRKELLAKAQGIITECQKNGRELTPAEQAEVQDLFAQIEAIDAKTADSAGLVDRLNNLGQPGAGGTKSTGAGWAKSVADSLQEKAGTMGVKALFTGEVDTPPAVEVAPLPSMPVRLLDLIPKKGLTENTFEYLRQVVKTNNAAPVADGATKPTSVYTFEPKEDRARVIAHLSEPFPIRFAQDHSSVMQVLDQQMLVGLLEAIEDLVINGDGTGEEWVGILNTSGVQTQAFATDVPTTLRKARTSLETVGVYATGLAMNPLDIEALDLIREDGAGGGYLMDGAAYERILGSGIRPVPSLAVPAGSAVLGNFAEGCRLRVRQSGHTMAATQAGDLFDTNRMKLRTEGRYGFEVIQPLAFSVVDLTAA